MELKDLYRDVILDHNRRPRNFGRLEGADAHAEGHNPLCGDRLTLSVKLAGDRIEDIRFEGKGCAISTASASLMSEAVKGKDREAVRRLFESVHELLTQQDAVPGEQLGKLTNRRRVDGGLGLAAIGEPLPDLLHAFHAHA